MIYLTSDWNDLLSNEFEKDYFKNLMSFVDKEYEKNIIYPSYEDIGQALNITSYQETRVVILGQDPYHGVGEAHGLSFSVQHGVKIPPSLRNIYQELNTDLGIEIPNHGCLTQWAEGGVLLLNTVLTVKKDMAHSHKDKGWEQFTDAIISLLNEKDVPIVFILWGKPASLKKKIITNSKHLIIEAPHPSPLSSYRGFFGSKPFSKSNEFLVHKGQEPINWEIKSI